MSGADLVRVVRKDAKFFWRARCTVDIDIVEHGAVDTFEVICYESSTNQHAMRMYFNRSILLARLDTDELGEKLRLAKEPFLRRHECPDEEMLRSAIRDDFVADFFLNRLSVAEYSPTVFAMSFESKAMDMKNGGVGGADMSRLVCEKPGKLVPYDPLLFHPLKVGEVDEALDALETEQRQLHKETLDAARLEGKVRRVSMVKERWRTPLVIAKVAAGKRLSDSDNKLWQAAMKKLQDDLEAEETGDVVTTLPTTELAATSTDSAAHANKAVTPVGRGHGALAKAKSNRWKDNSARTPKSHRKNSFTVGLAALHSSLQRTLGLSGKISTEDAMANAEHMRASVGADLDADAPSVVLSRHASNSANGGQSCAGDDQPAARSLMDVVAAHQERLRRENSAIHPVLLSRGPSMSMIPSSAVTPRGSRRSSRWTGERSQRATGQSKEELQAKRILQKLENGSGVVATQSNTTTHSRTGSFSQDISASGELSPIVRKKPVPSASSPDNKTGLVVAVSEYDAQDSEKFSEKVQISAKVKPSTLRQFFQQISFL